MFSSNAFLGTTHQRTVPYSLAFVTEHQDENVSLYSLENKVELTFLKQIPSMTTARMLRRGLFPVSFGQTGERLHPEGLIGRLMCSRSLSRIPTWPLTKS